MALPCKARFGEVRGREIQVLVEESTGDICPCKQGQPCPLLVRRTKDAGLLIPHQR